MKPSGFTGGILIAILCLLCMQVVSAEEDFFVSGDGIGDVAPLSENPAAIATSLSNMTLFFVPNEGQADPGVLFTCKGQGFAITYAKDRIGYSLPYDDGGAVGKYMVIQRFSRGNPDPVVEGLDPKETRVSYFSGDESEWHTNITPYGAIAYRDIYPGIDLVYRGISGSVKREFLVQPGVDPSMIRMTYEGAGQVRMTGDGGLVIQAGSGEILETPPVCYQDIKGTHVWIPCRFDVRDDGSVSFYVGTYDRSLPLVIDPALVYCGYVGGDFTENGYAIASDAQGSAYLTGWVTSSQTTFPETGGPDLSYNDGSDAFVAKVNSMGTGFVYCGYIGGSEYDEGRGIAVDSAGNAYVAGYTYSAAETFPVTAGSWDPSHNGGADAFVAKVNAGGTGLSYCGYIGGSGDDNGRAIALDSSGNAYVTGYTSSTHTTFPETVGPDLTHNGGSDAFVAKVNPGGTAVTYCGYIGGSEEDYGMDIAVDAFGSAYVTGTTSSSAATFPETAGSWDPSHNGSSDAFAAKVNPGGTMLTYCGYIGGEGADAGYAIAVHTGYNDAYVTGYTYSGEDTFPVTTGSLDTTHNGRRDAFVAKVNVGVLDYCGYIGGSGDDTGYGIAVDPVGNVYVTGETNSTAATFPEMTGPDISHNGASDAFVAKVNAEGSHLNYCGYIGGSGDDAGYGIALDPVGNVYVTGETNSTAATFPETVGPDLTHFGVEDAFVAKISAENGRGVFRPSAPDNWIVDWSMDGLVDIRDHYGVSTDIPLTGDFNNDGTADRALFRSGDWIIDQGIDGTTNFRDHYGQAGDIPIAGRINTGRNTDRAVFRAGEWIIDIDMDGTVEHREHYGGAGDIPLIGDFNNDGAPDWAVFRATAWENWIIDYSMDGMVNERDRFGQAGDIPVTGDFNLDGLTDRAVFRSGEWIIDYNMDGTVNSRPRFGQAGDIPLVWSG